MYIILSRYSQTHRPSQCMRLLFITYPLRDYSPKGDRVHRYHIIRYYNNYRIYIIPPGPSFPLRVWPSGYALDSFRRFAGCLLFSSTFQERFLRLWSVVVRKNPCWEKTFSWQPCFRKTHRCFGKNLSSLRCLSGWVAVSASLFI